MNRMYRKVSDDKEWLNNYNAIEKEERDYVNSLAEKYGRGFTFAQTTKEEEDKWWEIMKRMKQSIPPANTSLDKTLTKYGRNVNYDTDEWKDPIASSETRYFKQLVNKYGYLVPKGGSYDGEQFAELIRNSEGFGSDPDDEFYYELAKEFESIFKYGNGEIQYYIDSDETKQKRGKFSDSRKIKDSIDADFQNAIDIVKEVLDENQIDLTSEYESNSGTYTLEISRDNPSFVITSGYTSGSKKIDDKINDYFYELYDMAKDEYRADYPDVDEYESEGEEKAYEDALYNLDDDYRIYYEILIFKYDKYVSVDLEVMGQKGDTTLWDTDTVLKNDYIDVNDVEGIREQAQSVADFISNLHFD